MSPKYLTLEDCSRYRSASLLHISNSLVQLEKKKLCACLFRPFVRSFFFLSFFLFL